MLAAWISSLFLVGQVLVILLLAVLRSRFALTHPPSNIVECSGFALTLALNFKSFKIGFSKPTRKRIEARVLKLKLSLKNCFC